MEDLGPIQFFACQISFCHLVKPELVFRRKDEFKYNLQSYYLLDSKSPVPYIPRHLPSVGSSLNMSKISSFQIYTQVQTFFGGFFNVRQNLSKYMVLWWATFLALWTCQAYQGDFGKIQGEMYISSLFFVNYDQRSHLTRNWWASNEIWEWEWLWAMNLLFVCDWTVKYGLNFPKRFPGFSACPIYL